MNEHTPNTSAFAAACACVARGSRILLAAVASIIVLWSFVHVATRPLRANRDRADRVELTVLHWGDRDEDRITQSLVDSFEATHPHIRIKRINAGANYLAKLQTMIAAGTPPDVFFLNDYQIPIFASRSILMDVEPLMLRDAAQGTLPFSPDDLYPEAVDGFRFDGNALGSGTLYGIPMSFTPMGFYFNRTLFAQANIPEPREDWTWDDFEQTATALHQRLGIVGAAVDLRGAMLPRMLAWSQGTDLASPDFRRINANDPHVQSAMHRIRRWGQRGSPFRLFGDARQEVETGSGVFMAQRAAMYGPIGRWMVPTYRQISDFEWDFAPLPRGSQNRNVLYIAAWCIAQKTKHPEEAWAVARHFASPESQRINSSLGLALPTLRSVAQSDAFLNPAVPPRGDDVFLRAVPGSQPMAWPINSRLTVLMRNAMDASLRTQSTSIDTALASLQAEFDRASTSSLTGSTHPRMPWNSIALAAALFALLTAITTAVLWLRRRPAALARGTEYAGTAMASPWVLGLIAFVAIPMLVSLLLAMCSWSGLAPLDAAQWVGLGNFREIFTADKRFLRALVVTAIYALIAVPLTQSAALAAAMLMASNVPGVNAFRALWYLPTVLAGVAMAVMWWWVFDAEYGLANAVLRPILSVLNLSPPEWFGRDADWAAVLAFSLTSVWTFGGPMLIYLAGLNAIPRHLYEAASLDGARPLHRFINVTIPMLSPVILFNVIIAIIASFQVFTQAYIMTKGGPNDATLFYVLYVYEEAFEHHNMGYASALAWILFLVVLFLTALVMRFSRGRVHDEGNAR